jgi:hypothetical protein
MFGFSFIEEFKGIPTRDEWVQYTTSERVHHRGTTLLAIDTSLDHYHQSMASPSYGYGGLKAALEKIKIVTMQLVSILQVCEAWISAKSKAWELGQSSRAPLVRRLIKNTLEALEVLDPHRAAYDPTNPTVYFRHVASDYRWRMLLPLIHKSEVYDAHSPGKQLAPLNILEANSAVNPEHFLGSKIRQEFVINTEFNFVFDFIRQAKHNADRVMYLQEDHRWPHQIVFYQGLAYRVDQYGNRTETKATGDGQILISGKTRIIYFLNDEIRHQQAADLKRQTRQAAETAQRFNEGMARRRKFDGREIDRQEFEDTEYAETSLRRRVYSEADFTENRSELAPARLIARPDIDSGIATQHSTFLAGEPCFFAGGAVFSEAEAGTLVSLDNCSGHYQPTTQAMLDTLQFLKVSDASLDFKKITLASGGVRYNGVDWFFGAMDIHLNAEQAVDDRVLKAAIIQAQSVIYKNTIQRYTEEGMQIVWDAVTLQDALKVGAITSEEALAFGLKPKPRRPLMARIMNPFG